MHHCKSGFRFLSRRRSRRNTPLAPSVTSDGFLPPSPRVYVSDIDIGRTVEATAGIWSGTRIRSPRRGPISPGYLMVVTTDPNPFREVDDGWPDERCSHRCRPQ